MKKIAHLFSSGGYSGAENIAINIIGHTSEEYESFYISQDGPIVDILKEKNIKHIKLTSGSLPALKQTLKDENVDIIYAHDFKATIKACFVSSGKPVVSHIHQNPKWFSKVNIKTLLFLAASFRAKKIIYVSPETREEFFFSNLIKNKSVVLENFVDRNKIINESNKENSDEKKYDISFLGRLEQVKNPLMFLEIVKKFKSSKKDIKALVIGSGTLLSTLETFVLDSGLSDNVTFVGFQKNPYSYLKNSKVLVITSEWEGFGLNAVEANILKIPVVATPVGGLKSIITKDTGYLCSTISEFCEKIDLLLSNDELYENFRKGMADNETIYTDVNRWEKGISSILADI